MAGGYWIEKRGEDYRDQQELRRASGDKNYALQEQYLRDFVAVEASHRQVIKVLDFGCGFGRMLQQLSSVEGVALHGYDLSEAMAAPLLGRIASGELKADVRVAASLDEAFGDERFDLIYSVSVLIHNETTRAREIVAQMLSRLAPEGQLLLVENPVSCVSMLSSRWHGGCWVHDIAGDVAAGNRIVIDPYSVPGHGVYRITRPTHGPEVLVRTPDGVEKPVTRDDLVLLGFDQMVQAIRALEATESSQGDQSGRSFDAEEALGRIRSMVATLPDGESILPSNGGDLEVASALGKLGLRLHGLVAEVESARGSADRSEKQAREFAALATELQVRESALKNEVAEKNAFLNDLQSQHQDLEEQQRRQQLSFARLEHEAARSRMEVEAATAALRRRERIRAALSGTDLTDLVKPGVSPAASADHPWAMGRRMFEFNAIRDSRYANKDDRFNDVCHVFHQQWFGMRSAAGALPGAKLALSTERAMSAVEIEEVAEQLEKLGVKHLVVHGFSESMAAFCRGLAAEGGVNIHLVWHGAPVMWLHQEERALFFLARRLLQSGVFRRMHVMRDGNDDLLGDRGWKKQLLNMPPNVAVNRDRAWHRDGMTVVSPSWNLVHKNVYTNVFAALSSDRVEKVWVLAKDVEIPKEFKRKVAVLPTLDQETMLRSMAMADLVCNVSLVDCHPMVDLESLAVRTPCLRGPLHLGALEDHEYVRITQVENALSIDSIRRRIDGIAAMEPSTVLDAMADYHQRLVCEAADRYLEFIGV